MKITFDRSLEVIEYLKTQNPQLESLDIAIDTMRRYQKIKEIMVKRPKNMISSNPTLSAIRKVLEDGNVDN